MRGGERGERSDEEAQASLDAQNQQMMNQKAMEQVQQGAEVAQRLGSTPVGGAEETMLDRLIGGPGGAQ